MTPFVIEKMVRVLSSLRRGEQFFSAFPSVKAYLLFEREGESFRASLWGGYGEESPHRYAFLSERRDSWIEAIRSGAKCVEDADSAILGVEVWCIVDRPVNPSHLLVVEFDRDSGYGKEESALFLQIILQTYLRSSSVSDSLREPEKPTPLVRLLEETLPPLSLPSPLLVSGVTGSPMDMVAEMLLDKYGYPLEERHYFEPARLSGAVQLRELFGDRVGVRLDSALPSIPLSNRHGAVIINNVTDLAESAQARVIAYLSGVTTNVMGEWILCVTGDPELLVSKGELHAGFLQVVGKNRFNIPPLSKWEVGEIESEILRKLHDLSTTHKKNVDISPSALSSLSKREWAGDFYQLERSIESLFFTARKGRIDNLESIQSGHDISTQEEATGGELDLRKNTKSLERSLLLKAYALHGGNQVQMARALGISRGSLQYKMEKMGLLQER